MQVRCIVQWAHLADGEVAGDEAALGAVGEAGGGRRDEGSKGCEQEHEQGVLGRARCVGVY